MDQKGTASQAVIVETIDLNAPIRAFYWDERIECYVADHGNWAEYFNL